MTSPKRNNKDEKRFIEESKKTDTTSEYTGGMLNFVGFLTLLFPMNV